MNNRTTRLYIILIGRIVTETNIVSIHKCFRFYFYVSVLLLIPHVFIFTIKY